jgi:catechol 2,3-dioxygenase-like lactoylglutathione lyase family enzyme
VKLVPKATHHVSIFSRDVPALERFYTETLGLPVTRRWDDLGIVFVDVGSTTIELVTSPDRAPHPASVNGFDHLALHVDDVDAAFAALRDAGVTVESEPYDFKELRIAFVRDPDGNLLELVQE